MAQATRFNDPAPRVCVEFLPDIEQRFTAALNLPQQWSVGRQFGEHADKLRKQYGRHWRDFIGECGEFEAKLANKSLVLRFVFRGIDEDTLKPKFEVGDIEFRPLQVTPSAMLPVKWHKRLFRQLTSLRGWLILLSTIVGAATVLVSKGAVLGIEIAKLLGLISVALGTLTAIIYSASVPTESE